MGHVVSVLGAGAGNLAAYLAAHVLLCLLPAFFIAGAMAALIPKASITRWLGRNTPAHVSYPAAAAAGSLLAVCSCTIVPLFAGIYRKGAGLGPAMTFLFFAPAGNVLALDALIVLNGEGRLFGPMSDRTRDRIVAQAEQAGDGRAFHGHRHGRIHGHCDRFHGRHHHGRHHHDRHHHGRQHHGR